MNRIDKEFLITKGFINEQEYINEEKIQTSALLEATVFAGAILEASLDLPKLVKYSSYIEELAGKKQYMHLHLYVQRCLRDCKVRSELDGFYVASLHEETMEEYALYFTMYLRKLVNDISDARKKIIGYQEVLNLIAQKNILEIISISK